MLQQFFVGYSKPLRYHRNVTGGIRDEKRNDGSGSHQPFAGDE